MTEEEFELGPLAEAVVDGFAERAFLQDGGVGAKLQQIEAEGFITESVL